MSTWSLITWPIDLTGEQIKLEENSGGGWSTVATIDTWATIFNPNALYYFTRTDTSTESALVKIEEDFNAASANNTYQFQANTTHPFKGSDAYALSLVATTYVDTFRVSTTGNMISYLGAGDNTTQTESGGQINFDNHPAGSFYTQYKWNWNDDRLEPEQIAEVVRTVTNDIHVFQRDELDGRFFRLLALPGALVYENRHTASKYNDATLNYNEEYAAFEHFWRTCISQGREFRYYWDMSTIDSLDHSSDNVDTMVVEDEDHVLKMKPMLTDRTRDFGTEYYDVEFTALQKAQAINSPPNPPAPTWQPSDEAGAYWLLDTTQLTLSDVDDVDSSGDVSDGDRGTTAQDQIGTLDATQTTVADKALVTGAPTFLLDFDGSDDHYDIGAVSDFNFLHETGGQVHLALKMDSFNDNSLHVLLDNTGLTTANQGFSIYYDDRSSVSREKRFVLLVTKGSAGNAVFSTGTTDNAISDSDLHIISFGWDCSSGGVANIFVDQSQSALFNSGSRINSPGTGNANDPLRIGDRSTTTLSPANTTIGSIFISQTVPADATELESVHDDFYTWATDKWS